MVSRRGTGRGGPQSLPASDVFGDLLSSVADGADHGRGSGRLECMSGRQYARTGSGGASSKPWDIQQADKSIRVRNAGESRVRGPVQLSGCLR